MPYAIVVKPLTAPTVWVPFVNVKSKFEPFVNRSVLHVSTLDRSCLAPNMRFTSYCTKAPPDVVARRQSTSSSTTEDTVIGSPVMSPSGSPNRHGTPQRRKRMCRSTSDIKCESVSACVTPTTKRDKPRRATCSSHV